MRERGRGPDFIEALARGLDVIKAFDAASPVLSMSEIAQCTGLARPTVRRILLTLEELGYVRSRGQGFSLTPRVVELGMSYVHSMGLWDIARPRMEELVAKTGESSSIAQLDGSDIMYVARVAVPRIVALRVVIGTRFPAAATSLGKVLLADLPPGEVEPVLAEPSRAGVVAHRTPPLPDLLAELEQIRSRGWAMTDQDLAAGIRSVAAPVRDGSGAVIAALNVNAHAAETPLGVLRDRHLPHLLATAAAISGDFAVRGAIPESDIARGAPRPGP
ncbi:IclR family transcriptional regulator domain-containing protein [Streptomyces sp. NRRL F-5126]|uniref:IclR family transcriptional regulator domain-containing protein n=1 Tax=Streptomyces sp. NRRL F-5126 TaxID=1463857 RepID=UPI00068A6208|nr:IclR family transcriptional regulator C-terminal domain-containing protein [Streptomyces sp. NRRL F-5126]